MSQRLASRLMTAVFAFEPSLTEPATKASEALIKADPVFGSLAVLFMLTTALAVWRWVAATRELVTVQQASFDALSKRDEATTKVVNEAIRGYEDLQSKVAESISTLKDMRVSQESLEKQYIAALAALNARGKGS